MAAINFNADPSILETIDLSLDHETNGCEQTVERQTPQQSRDVPVEPSERAAACATAVGTTQRTMLIADQGPSSADKRASIVVGTQRQSGSSWTLKRTMPPLSSRCLGFQRSMALTGMAENRRPPRAGTMKPAREDDSGIHDTSGRRAAGNKTLDRPELVCLEPAL